MKSHKLNAAGEDLLHALPPPIDFFRVVKVLLSRWYWLIACILVALAGGIIFMKVVKARYMAEATLEYLDKKSMMEDLHALSPENIFSSGSNGFMAEKYKIASSEVIKHALLNTRPFFHFWRVKDFRLIDPYPFVPLVTELIFFNENEFDNGEFYFSEDLKLSYHADGIITELDYTNELSVQVKGLIFKVNKVNTAPGYQYVFAYAAGPKRLKEVREKLQLKEVSDQASVMKLTFKHHNQHYVTDFLNHLLKAYETYDLKEKQVSTDHTLGFIHGKLKELEDSLNRASADLKLFRTKTQLSEPEVEIRELGLQIRAMEDQRQKLLMEKEFIDLLYQNADTTITGVIDFFPLGWDDHADKVLVGLLNQYNQLVSKRKEILATQLPAAVEARNNEIHIIQTRRQLLENLRFQRIRNAHSLEFIHEQLREFHARLMALPAQAQDYKSLLGNFQVNEQKYALLINKQLEVSLTKSGIIPSFKIIDIHEVEKLFPQKKQTLLLFGLTGLLIGCLMVMGKRRMTSRFYRFDDLSGLRHVSLGGVIPHFGQKLQEPNQDLAVLNNDRSAFSEAFSNLRMQVSRLDINKGKIIVITSHGAGDGKSFIGLNLALSFTRMNRKVLLAGADLRMPSLDKYFHIKEQNGLKEYLEDPSIDKSEIICKTSIQHLDYISAGRKPGFNSTELLLGPHLIPLLNFCKSEYDIIILDTPPVGLITDAIPLMQQADCIFYAVRWLFSDASAAQNADLLCRQYGFENMSLLINDYYHDNLYQPLIREKLNFWLPGKYASRSDGNGYYLSPEKKAGHWIPFR